MNKKMLLVAAIASTILSGCGGSDNGTAKEINKVVDQAGNISVDETVKEQFPSTDTNKETSENLPASTTLAPKSSSVQSTVDHVTPNPVNYKQPVLPAKPKTMQLLLVKHQGGALFLQGNKGELYEVIPVNGLIKISRIDRDSDNMNIAYQLEPGMNCGDSSYDSSPSLKALFKINIHIQSISVSNQDLGKYKVTSEITRRKDENGQPMGTWVCKVTVLQDKVRQSDFYFIHADDINEIRVADFDKATSTYKTKFDITSDNIW
ncbi:hypothetical protein A9264_09730 [Vibrio sp. UCD-FRSSP16_10]|uniref:hypothetical protein n=1 Tax=unclassified Vibrio TaxID=2614977 RepID=UPI0007FDEE1E|nr:MULTISPECIES: hypothetical protein [unclassified Vibrio]OBT16998.1 hypothetical protein A9260_09955 [Vibrio sp. UCD-FRSSP16_30]OBT21989.1 hypothetical protein A9264_09730 [Vibrio sp. UCD-FRSSP16_10]